MHNYGIYKGTHEMNLMNKSGKRNITLIGGLNGRGKTTFHDAVLIALYGKQALKYIQEKERSYDKLLIDYINKHKTDEETYVAVSLVLDDGTRLQIKRSWKLKKAKVEQQIFVEKDGILDKYLGDNWSYYVEEILPFGIAKFFFFNNEKITQLADDKSFEQIKSSIKSAIGISTIEKTIVHVDEVMRRKKSAIKAFEASELNQSYQEVESQIREIDQRQENLTRELHSLERKCQEISARLDAKENEFWSSGGDLSRNRDSIKAERDRIAREVEHIQFQIQQMVSDAAIPLTLCRRLIIESYDREQTQQSDDAKRYTERIIVELQQRIIRKLNEAKLPAEILNAVKDIVNDELGGHASGVDDIGRVNMSPTSMMLYQRLISEVFPSINEKINKLITSADVQESEYMNLDAHLGAADEKTVAMQLYEVLKSYEQEKALADEEYRRKEETIESLRNQRKALIDKRVQLIKGMVEKENANDDNVRIIKYAAMAIETLREFKKRLQKEKVDKLSQTVTECFQTLVEKNSLVQRIDIDTETLDITIIDTDGRELLKNQLSAGEQQMFAVSVVWALALTSGYKAPVIVDTPMARLDSSHRTNFVTKYLPAASSQVLVLSTDEEIYGKYLESIRENIIDCFTLLYQEEEQCTYIVKGYFEET